MSEERPQDSRPDDGQRDDRSSDLEQRLNRLTSRVDAIAAELHGPDSEPRQRGLAERAQDTRGGEAAGWASGASRQTEAAGGSRRIGDLRQGRDTQGAGHGQDARPARDASAPRTAAAPRTASAGAHKRQDQGRSRRRLGWVAVAGCAACAAALLVPKLADGGSEGPAASARGEGAQVRKAEPAPARRTAPGPESTRDRTRPPAPEAWMPGGTGTSEGWEQRTPYAPRPQVPVARRVPSADRATPGAHAHTPRPGETADESAGTEPTPSARPSDEPTSEPSHSHPRTLLDPLGALLRELLG